MRELMENWKTFAEEKEVTKAAIIFIFDEDKFLLLRRSKTDLWMPGKWGLPGGKIDPGETPEEAVVRETMEEAGLSISSPRLLAIDEGRYHYYITKEFSGDEVKLSFEHDDYQWADINKLDHTRLVPQLRKFIDKAREENEKASGELE